MSGRKQIGTAHFTITGEFMTNHARELWQEYKFSKVWSLLDCLIGITREQQEAILLGKKKLIGENNVELVDDDWTPPDGYASFKEAAERGEHWRELQERRDNEAEEYAHREWWPTRGSTNASLKYFAHLEGLVGVTRAKQLADAAMQRHSENSMMSRIEDEEKETKPRRPTRLEMANHAAKMRMEMAGMDVSILKDPIGMLDRGKNLTPKLCSDMSSESGWLLLDGKYYGCGYMEHIGLAETLLARKTRPGNAEEVGEKLGWVKIAKGLLGLNIVCQKRPTQKQFTKIWDYCQFHKIDYEGLTIVRAHRD